MEIVYRGYPLLHAMEQEEASKPYMLYRREEQVPEVSRQNTGTNGEDFEYFKGLYPQSVKKCQQIVSEGCDLYDYPGSPIYDEYPDREILYRMRDKILKKAREQNGDENRDVVQLLLLFEIQRRRGQNRGRTGSRAK